MFGPNYPLMQHHIPEECEIMQILYNIGKIIYFLIIIIIVVVVVVVVVT